jgi:hypothetical protein
MELRKFIATTIREYLNEQVENSDNDLKILFYIARKFDDPYKFDDYLNRNKLGHIRDYSFIGERFRRLHRGTRLSGNDKIEIFRTGDEPIKWGDYIYLDYYDAKQSYDAGQGNKIYKKVVPKSDVIETSVSGEFYYSPKKIANIGEDLIDLWNYVNGTAKKDEIETDNIKDRIKLFNKELIKLKGKYHIFDEYENEVFNLAKRFNVPAQNYEKYFY